MLKQGQHHKNLLKLCSGGTNFKIEGIFQVFCIPKMAKKMREKLFGGNSGNFPSWRWSRFFLQSQMVVVWVYLVVSHPTKVNASTLVQVEFQAFVLGKKCEKSHFWPFFSGRDGTFFRKKNVGWTQFYFFGAFLAGQKFVTPYVARRGGGEGLRQTTHLASPDELWLPAGKQDSNWSC